MGDPVQKSVSVSVDGREVVIRSFCRPGDLDAAVLPDSASKHPQYRPIVSTKGRLERAAAAPDANVTLAQTAEGTIVGFALLEYPAPEERWSRVGNRGMMEVSVIQVNPEWRGRGIARGLLRLLVDHPLKEERIFYMVGYSWTWDLEGKSLSAMKYRDMLIGMFSAQGFRIFQTNEPNVMVRPENLFMARIGAGISEETAERFKRVRFDMDRFL